AAIIASSTATSATCRRRPPIAVGPVILRDGGMADFDALHSRKHDDEVRLVAFDILAVRDYDIRPALLHARKHRLEMLLAMASDGIQLSEHLHGEIGPAIFDQACKLGLEGIVS